MSKQFEHLYLQLAAYYQERIAAGHYKEGEQIDSINRIVSRHGVSRDTAKLVLQQLNREGWATTIAGRGTFATPQREVKKAWAVIIPLYSSNMEQLLSYLHSEALAVQRDFSYYLHYNQPDEEQRLVRQLIHEGYESIMVVPNYDETLTTGFYARLICGKTRLILLDNTMTQSTFNCVIQSYELGIKRALEYFQQQGKSNILLVKNEQWKGRNLLHEYIENSLYVHAANRQFQNISTATVMEIDAAYCRNRGIDAIICNNDHHAATLVGRLASEGMVLPGELSLINYGNTSLTRYFTPAISVIDCKYKQLAARAAALTVKIQKNQITEQHIIQPELKIRKT